MPEQLDTHPDKRTLVLEVAVPNFYLRSEEETKGEAEEWFDGDEAAWLWEELRIANPDITFDLNLEGEKDAGTAYDVKGVIVGARIQEGLVHAE